MAFGHVLPWFMLYQSSLLVEHGGEVGGKLAMQPWRSFVMTPSFDSSTRCIGPHRQRNRDP